MKNYNITERRPSPRGSEEEQLHDLAAARKPIRATVFIWNFCWTYFSSFPFPKLYWIHLLLNKTTKDISVFICKAIHMFFFFSSCMNCVLEMKKKAKCETMRMFWKLFQYINGSNDKAEKINMTSPVLNKFSIGDDNKTVNMAMYFYIFREDGEDVPKPTDSSLRVVDDLKMCVYSHCFLSYHMRIRPWEMMRHVKMLKCALKEDGLENTVKKGSVFLAVYDGPEKRRRRRNEIWIQKEM